MIDNIDKAAGVATGVLAGIMTYLFGGADAWFVAFCALVVLDYITGVLTAIITKELSSRVGLMGIAKKLLLFAVVAVGNIIDTAVGAGGALRAIVLGFMAANEGISILENSARAGVPWPEKLMDVLRQLKDKEK